MQKLKNSKGFTIVELLIVIVIIGILATIGFVAFSNAQNRAKRSNAESALSQIKSKLGEYNADNDSYPDESGTNGMGNVIDFLRSEEGGNNQSLADKVDSGGELDRIEYESDGDGFVLTAPSEIWKGDEDIVVTN